VIELIQIERGSGIDFRLKKIYINPRHIIFISEDNKYKMFLDEGKMNLDLDKNVVFSKIRLNEGQYASEIIVVGDPSSIQSKLMTNQKVLLKG
jgi:hypothetical protein